MTVETSLAQCLLASAALTGVTVRAEVAQPTDKTPYIIHTQILGTRVSHLRGDSNLANSRFQIDVYADTKALTSTYKAAIRNAILANAELGATLINESSGYEPDTKRYRHRQDFSIWFRD